LARRKKISRSDIIGDKGIALIHRLALDMGFVWNSTGLEAGIDGYIEIRDETTGDVTNCILQVQSKATAAPFAGETDSGFHFVCEERDLDYWIGGNAPVILIVSRPDTNEAYWVSVKDYFRDPDRRKQRKVHFDKRADRFDRACRDRLARLAIPDQSGLYLSSLPRPERLVLNLLPVADYPRRIFRAKTRFRKPAQLWTRLRSLVERPAGEWALHEGYLYCFHDLTFKPWSQVCNVNKAENLATSDFAFSAQSAQRGLFVQMLNRCLRELLGRHSVRFSDNKECYYFRASSDFTPRKHGTRTVFAGYASKKEPDRIAYYRHWAFRPRFLLFDKTWYLEITPTYHFTFDGIHLSRHYEERLSGIKMRERQNKTHLAQVKLWADLLQGRKPKGDGKCKQRSLWEEEEKQDRRQPEPYTVIRFDPLMSFDVGFGIEDAAWLPIQGDEPSEESTRLPLFDP
jgi:hypothetical protein